MSEGPSERTNTAAPIGVFDSGVGGLSVLRALLTTLPLERFVYVADSGHAPYGERSDDYVLERSQRIAHHLLQQHRIKALVVACNTATAAAIHTMRQQWAPLPIVGIEPAIKPAALQSQTRVVGVLATRGTLQSEKFRSLLQSLHGQATFVLQACDGLADAIERNDHERTAALCQQYLQALGTFGSAPGAMDTLVLGCTHYPFAQDALRRWCGPNVQMIEAGAPVAQQTLRVLQARGLLASQAPHPNDPRLQALSTGTPEALQRALWEWLGCAVEVQPLDA